MLDVAAGYVAWLQVCLIEPREGPPPSTSRTVPAIDKPTTDAVDVVAMLLRASKSLEVLEVLRIADPSRYGLSMDTAS